MHKTLTTILGAFVLIVILMLVNGISKTLLSPFFVDLTEEKLYSLSEGSRNVLAKIESPIRLRFYYSRSDSAAFPQMRVYAGRVADLLRQYERAGGGMIILEEFDPQPDTEEEDWAIRYGLRSLPRPDGLGDLFLGLVGIDAAGSEKAIPVFDPAREAFLEYDITRLIYGMTQQDKPLVGIFSPLPIEGGASGQQPQMGNRPPQPSWFFVEQLRHFNDVEFIKTDATTLPEGIDILVLVHPRKMTDAFVFAVDQFVLGGGKLIALVDPFCMSDPTTPPQTQNPMAAAAQVSKRSDLDELLPRWGLSLVDNKAVGDLNLATPVREPQSGQETRFPLWLTLGPETIDRDDAVTGSLDNMMFPWAGELEIKPTEGVSITPLITTTDSGILFDEKIFAAGGGNACGALAKSRVSKWHEEDHCCPDPWEAQYQLPGWPTGCEEGL